MGCRYGTGEYEAGREKSQAYPLEKTRLHHCTHPPVDVLVGRDGVRDPPRVDGLRGVQGQLDDQTVNLPVLVDSPDVPEDLKEDKAPRGHAKVMPSSLLY